MRSHSSSAEENIAYTPRMNPYVLLGAVACLPFAVAGLLLTKNGLLQGIFYLLATLLISFGTIYAQNRFFVSVVAKKCFIYMLPFALLFLFCTAVLQWGIVIPFYTAMQFAAAVPGTFAVAQKKRGPESIIPPLATALASSVLFALFAVIFGIKG